MPRPRTEGGIIVALAYLDTAMKVPDDSTRATNAATIIANDSPASNVGAPHWKGYGTRIQGAPPTSPERSTRQWTCVFVRAFLYAPLTVRMYAYSHTIAIVKITENRSNTGFAAWAA